MIRPPRSRIVYGPALDVALYSRARVRITR
jgi:hypothetical protein